MRFLPQDTPEQLGFVAAARIWAKSDAMRRNPYCIIHYVEEMRGGATEEWLRGAREVAVAFEERRRIDRRNILFVVGLASCAFAAVPIIIAMRELSKVGIAIVIVCIVLLATHVALALKEVYAELEKDRAGAWRDLARDLSRAIGVRDVGP